MSCPPAAASLQPRARVREVVARPASEDTSEDEEDRAAGFALGAQKPDSLSAKVTGRSLQDDPITDGPPGSVVGHDTIL